MKISFIPEFIRLATIILVFIVPFTATAQQNSYFDPAQAYNRLLIEKNNGTYTQVGNFKVVGSSFLYGEKNNGNLYGTNETGRNLPLSYDTYTQNVYFFPNGAARLTKEPATLDSFTINKNTEISLEWLQAPGLIYIRNIRPHWAW
jgi:hypothetical protein